MINPASVAVDGVGFGPAAMAVLGWGRLSVEVIKLPRAAGGGSPRPHAKEKRPELQTFLYKNTLVTYDPIKDWDKKVVILTFRMKNGDAQFSQSLLVDAERAALMVTVINFLNTTAAKIKVSVKLHIPESINVAISGLKERTIRLRDYLNRTPPD